MESNSDSPLLETLVESLQPSNSDSAILSTCNFLQTVVVFDFPAETFLYHRQLFICLLDLCQNSSPEVSVAAEKCVVVLCSRIIAQENRKKSASWMKISELISHRDYSRNPGDGYEEQKLTLVGLALVVAKKCHAMILASSKPFYFILHLLDSASNLSRQTAQVTSENLEFCLVLASISVAVRAASRQNFVSCLFLLVKSIRKCPFSSLSNEVVYEIYNGLLDASIIHYHKEIFPIGQLVIKENLVLSEKYEKITKLFVAFKNLAKFLKNHSMENDLIPIISLLKLDSHLAESLLPCIFKHLKEFGGKPEDTLTLLQLSGEETISEQIYHHLSEIASPLKNLSIGSHIANLLVDEAVLFAMTDSMYSNNDKIASYAEKIISLVLKGKLWMKGSQWRNLMESIIPKLLVKIQDQASLQRLKILGPLLWDLINHSLILPADDSSIQLNLNFVTRFLIRNMSLDSVQREKSSFSLVSVLCQQSEAGQLRPRISSIEPSTLSTTFQGDLSLSLQSTAKFDASKLKEALISLNDSDLVSTRTSLMKLSILLEDISLHAEFLLNDGEAVLVGFLQSTLLAGDDEAHISIVSSIVKCLLYIAHNNQRVQKELSSNTDLILNIIRVTILTREDIVVRRHCIALLRLLCKEFDGATVAITRTHKITYPQDWPEYWSQGVIRWSAKFVFNAELTSTPPLIQSVPQFLKMTTAEQEYGMAANEYALMERALSNISNAKEHRDVEYGLSLLREILLRPDLPIEVFDLSWKESFETYFCVLPESSKDELVFASILETLLLSLFQLDESAANSRLSQWLFDLITDEKHFFWTVFQEQCNQYNQGSGCERLWLSLLQFLCSTVHMIANTRPVGSLTHILRHLNKTLEQDNQSMVYQLNSLKLILDCLIETSSAIYSSSVRLVEQPLLVSLFRYTNTTIVSFGSGRSQSNKGRSIVRCCSLLLSLLSSLSKISGKEQSNLIELSSQSLMILLQYSEPVVKSSGLSICSQLFIESHIPDEISELAVGFLFDSDENCMVIEQAAVLLSLHPRRMTEEIVRQTCLLASSLGIDRNQLLLSSLCQMLVNCLNVQAAPANLTTILNEFIPSIPDILCNGNTTADVKMHLFALLFRTSIFEEKLVPWLFQDNDSIIVAVHSLESNSEGLVGQAALFLTRLLKVEMNHSSKVLQLVLQEAPTLWNLFLFLAERKLEDIVARHVLIFIHSVLEAAWNAELMVLLQLDSEKVENFFSWLFGNLPTKVESSLRHSAIQVLGMILVSCPSLTPESIKLTSDFVVKELQLSTTSRCSDSSVMFLVQLAHNFVIRHRDAERQLLQRGIFPPLIDLWKNRSSRDSTASLLLSMIKFEMLLIGRETSREALHLFRLMVDYLEDREITISRQLTPITEDEWLLISTLHDMLLESVPSLECRRVLAKYRCWNSLSQTWHPIHLKRIINKQQHVVLTTLNRMRARLLSKLLEHSEPTLPDLTDSGAVQTLVDLASLPGGNSISLYALTILRNMAFYSPYKNTLLSTSSVLPFFVRVFTSEGDNNNSKTLKNESIMAIAALISLASNNQRVKSELRSITHAWFQRNPIAFKDDTTNKFFELCHKFHKLIDV